MHPFEYLIAWLIATDIIWGVLVALWLVVAIPVGLLITRKRNKK